MIPDFWLSIVGNVFATVVTATLIGGKPVFFICPDGHTHYAIEVHGHIIPVAREETYDESR